MNTPADKPDLPVTDWYAAWSGNCLYGVYDNESEAEDEARRIGTNGRHSGLYTADTVRRLLADERRKALEFARDVAMEYAPIHVIGANIAHRLQFEVDRKEPT